MIEAIVIIVLSILLLLQTNRISKLKGVINWQHEIIATQRFIIRAIGDNTEELRSKND